MPGVTHNKHTCTHTHTHAHTHTCIHTHTHTHTHTPTHCLLCPFGDKQNSGAITSYLVILGDLLPHLMDELLNHLGVSTHPWGDRTFLLIAACVIVVLPLVSARRLGFLSYTSGTSIVTWLVFCVILAIKSFDVHSCPYTHLTAQSPHVWDNSDSKCRVDAAHMDINTFYVLPTLFFAFVCHTSALPIYTELEDRSPKRMMRVAACGIFISFCIYLLAGLFGYKAFRDYVLGDVLLCLQSYFSSSPLVVILTILVCFAVLVTVSAVKMEGRRRRRRRRVYCLCTCKLHVCLVI